MDEKITPSETVDEEQKSQAENPEETQSREASQEGAAEAAETAAEEESCSPEEKKIQELEEALKKAQAESADYLDRLRRTMAEFDNFRKRTEKEKEQERANGINSVLLSTVLPMLDNLERAKASIPEAELQNATAKGVDMVYQKTLETLKSMDVQEIPAYGEQFDPKLHNAVMHIEDEKVDENTVVEVFQKGYTHAGTVIRYSMVKVAN